MRVFFAILVSLWATAGVAQDYSYTVKRGETIRVFSWSFFDTTCRKTQIPEVRATQNPKLGRLAKGTAQLKIRHVVDAAQSHCIGRSVEGAVVNYTAGDKAGTDTFTLSRKRMRGKDARYRISVTVK